MAGMEQFMLPSSFPSMLEQGPRGELGKTGAFSSATTGTSWNHLMVEDEHVPELVWPRSVRVYNGMRNDPQVAGLLRGSTLPIRRYFWYVDPNGADKEVASKVAEDLGLPLMGQARTPRLRSQGRFKWDEHLRVALNMSLTYGHMYFEQIGEIDNNGEWRLRKLAERMPSTIIQFGVDDTGMLQAIKQQFNNAPWIPLNRMMAYIHEQEGGNWVGRSQLRSLYQPWLLKDRLLRVDITRHERNGAGMPIVELPPGATRAQRKEAAALAQMYRVGQGAGGALPAGMKLTLQGVQGNVSDTLASIRFHNEEMARSWLMMFMQLGQTESGSRALGKEFIDFFSMSQESLAIFARDMINEHMIEDWVDWNVGLDSPVPLVQFRREENNQLSARDLSFLVQWGAIQVDSDLEEFLREFYRMPAPGGKLLPTPANPLAGQPDPASTAPVPLKIAPAKDGKKAAASLASSHPERAERAGDLPPTGTPVAASSEKWPYRRLPTDHELAAATDFPKLDQQWQNGLNRLLKKYAGIQAAQIEELVSQIDVAVDPIALMGVSASGGGTDIIADAMQKLITQGATLAREEAKAQGLTLSASKALLDSEKIVASSRAGIIDQLLANALTQSAVAKALQVSPNGGGGPDVAAKVEAHLNALKGRFVEDQLGGALTAAQNAGRRAVFAEAPDNAKFYASEILDDATCVNCAAEDGTQFENWAEAQVDYPSGGYDACLGGSRCRGTVVAVYDEA